MIRLASATSSSALLFSKLQGLSAKGRFESGEKMDALHPLPTRLISIWYPLYSGCHVEGRLCRQDLAGNAPALALFQKPSDSVDLPLKYRLRARRAPAPEGFCPGRP